MKLHFVAIALLSGALLVHGQGTLVWDQGDTNLVDGTGSLAFQPLGQSFTPAFSSIGVVEFYLGGASGASGDIEVNLRSGSITGTILGTTAAVSYSTTGIYDFFFSDPITLTPGTKYYLNPVALNGSGVDVNVTFFQYPGGDAIFGGTTSTDSDLWFQEGIVTNVPEPSSAVLFIVAASALFWHRRKRRIT